MLADLSNTLRVLLRTEGDATMPKLLEDVEVSFDRPSEGFAPTQATVDLFLYDLREEAELRTNERGLAYRPDGSVLRLPPPLRLDCSYMLTAWPAAGQANASLEEQRLLGEAVQILARHELIPADYRQGLVRTMDPPPRLRVAVGGEERGRSLADFWSAVGNKLRPSIMLKVTAAVSANLAPSPDFLATAVGLSVRDADPTSPADLPATPSVGPFNAVGGRVTSGGRPAAGAVVRLARPARSAVADENGVFRLGALPPGTYAAVVEGLGPDGVARRKSFDIPSPVAPDGLVTIELAP